ncbi:hypothetical protein K2173_028396 [Erythroxylum novogranatense]|uniref:Uncharacterized protein n=1 Tax=Erythroxylum novogranatense TaxID=1862640 RepID=A0AAV8U529_9ROSI|nr:hypothetical protein K2173_028396 [Erythroxylum novogranatense]
MCRKQSCMSCGDRSSVDELGIVCSASTMSTVSLELTKFINPELTWKTVAKRYRSTLRRTRKSVDRKSNVRSELSDEGPKKADATSVSDTEKHGVAILGRRFSEDIEHVPIKKRRFMTQSTSLTSKSPSPYFEVPEPNLNCNAHFRKADTPNVVKITTTVSDDSNFDNSEDFSGIEILASVACNDGVEEISPLEEATQEGVGSSSTSAMPFEDTAVFLTDKMEASSFLNNTDDNSGRSPTGNDERLLFDLNAVPCDNSNIDFQVDSSQSVCMSRCNKLQDFDACDNQQEPKETGQGHIDGLVSSDTRPDQHSSADLKGLPHCSYKSGTEEQKTEALSDENCRSPDKFVSSPSCIAQEPSTSDFVEVKTSRKLVEDPSDESHESNISQAGPVQMVGTENTLELQAGYDSQFEDGELRESDACIYWDENGEEGDVEQLDYGSDCEEKASSDLVSVKEIEVERGHSPGSGNGIGIPNFGTRNSQRDESVGTKSRPADVTTDKDCSARAIVLGPSSKELLSRIEEPDAIRMKEDAAPRSRANNFGNIHCRDTREPTLKKFLERDRFTANVRARSPGSRCYTNRTAQYWEMDRSYSPTYRNPYCSGPPRPRSVIESHGCMMASDYSEPEDAGYAGFDSRNYRHRGYERNVRKRSPVKRHYDYAIDTRTLPVGESLARSKFRRYQQGVGRGLREEYNRRISESPEYPNHTHRLARRERSISPLGRGRTRYGLRNSPSRSRCRSPATYGFRSERNEGSRRLSRSPDFRPDARVDRMRLPFQKPFGVTYEDGYVSPTRNHITSQHSSRWFDERNSALRSHRERKSPIRIFRQSQRYNSGRHINRMGSNDQFRLMRRSRKFPEMGLVGREREYEGSDEDRKKRSNRYEMVHRVRRYDADGVQRYNTENSLVGNDSHDYDNCNRVTDRTRDALRGGSED